MIPAADAPSEGALRARDAPVPAHPRIRPANAMMNVQAAPDIGVAETRVPGPTVTGGVSPGALIETAMVDAQDFRAGPRVTGLAGIRAPVMTHRATMTRWWTMTSRPRSWSAQPGES